MRTNTHTTKKAMSAKRTRTTRTTKSVKSKATKKATPKSLKGLNGVIPIRKLSVEALEQGLWQNRLCSYDSLNSYYADELNEAGKKRALLKFYKDLRKSDKKEALETARDLYEYYRR